MKILPSSLTLTIALVFVASSWGQNPFPCELSGGEGDPATGGLSNTQSGQYHDNSVYFNLYEFYEPVTIVSAKVFANGGGPRSLAVLSMGGDVLQTLVVDIPDGESVVELGWEVGPGVFGLGSISNDPQLWRDDLNSDINYPYALGDYGAITGTNIDGDNEYNYYYFFYDVTVEPQGPSVNSGGYPCLNVELLDVESLANLGGGDNGNDCWGWSDPVTGREIAIFGRSNGTSFIDVTSPTDMKYFANLPTQTSPSLWRDIKVNGDFAYIVSEAGEHGMQVVDLNALLELPLDEVTVLEPDAFYAGFGNAHNIMINEDTDYAYAIGTNTFGGGMHIMDISSPLEPVLVGAYDGAYSHDIHPVVYTGPDQDYFGREIVFCFNGSTGFAIVDVEDKGDTELISSLSYNNLGYTHQGWVSDDQRLCFFNDELDEMNFGNNTRTYIMDIADLDAPEIIGYFEAPVESIDHNLYVIGDKIYQSNYLSGLRILDNTLAGSGTLELVGYFDTNPESDAPSFDGTWSNYPYFASGNIGVSTMSHFFMLQPSANIAPSVESGTVERQVDASFSVFPNPASDFLVLNGFQGRSSLELIDMQGKIVKAWAELPVLPGLHLDLSGVPNGVYSLRLVTSGKTTKVIIQ